MEIFKLENGFTPCGNKLLEALIRSSFTLRELKVILTVLRFTHGFRREEAELSVRFISKATGIKFNHIGGIIENLKLKNILSYTRTGIYQQGRLIVLNKDFTSWNFNSSPKRNSSRLRNYIVPGSGTIIVPKSGTKKEIYKENINKVFTHWNSKNIINHKKLNVGIESKIHSVLNDFTCEEILTAIDNYNFILTDDEYYFKYKWTLKDFLQRGLEKFLDKETAAVNYLKHDGRQNTNNVIPLFDFNFKGQNNEQDGN